MKKWAIISVDPGIVNCGVGLITSEGDCFHLVHHFKKNMENIPFDRLIFEVTTMMDNLYSSQLHEILKYDYEQLFVVIEVNSKYPFSEFAGIIGTFMQKKAEKYIQEKITSDRVHPTAVLTVMKGLGLKFPTNLITSSARRKLKKEWTKKFIQEISKLGFCDMTQDVGTTYDEYDAVFNAIYYARKIKLIPKKKFDQFSSIMDEASV